MDVTRERTSRILELKEVLLSFQTGLDLVNAATGPIDRDGINNTPTVGCGAIYTSHGVPCECFGAYGTQSRVVHVARSQILGQCTSPKPLA